jgi:isopentenyl-diphosphate delta-isomerase
METRIPAWIDGTLVPVDKLAAHEQGLRHKAVSVFVIHDGEILIQQRAAGKYHTPLLWANTCCTHPHWNEDPETCATRRLTEELGLRGLPMTHRGQIEYRADVGGGMIEHELVDLFLSTPQTRPLPEPNPAEVAATRWITPEALEAEIAANPAHFTPWLRIYLADHPSLVFGPA